MLGQWRLALRQAEETAKAGRYEEALAGLAQPSVCDHRQVIQLRSRLANDLLDRGGRRAEVDDFPGAIGDIALAERHGAPAERVARARLELADDSVASIDLILQAGDPARALEGIERLSQQSISSPGLRHCLELAEAWKRGLAESRRGEFGVAREALEQARRLAKPPVLAVLEAVLQETAARQAGVQEPIERLYKAMAVADPNWGEVLLAAEAVLELVPDHPVARQARAGGWQRIAALRPGAALPASPFSGLSAGLTDIRQRTDGVGTVLAASREVPDVAPGQAVLAGMAARGTDQTASSATDSFSDGRFYLWADAIGGYLICLESQVVLGRAGPDSQADVTILGDLSRRHATLTRQGDGYSVQPHQPTFLNGQPILNQVPLRDQDRIRLGDSVELVFRQPSPVSATARLDLISRHRMPLAVSAAILMAETCILGPGPQSHVPAPRLSAPVVLFRQAGQLWCRARQPFEVDGRPFQERSALPSTARVQGAEFSFSLEPLGPRVAVS